MSDLRDLLITTAAGLAGGDGRHVTNAHLHGAFSRLVQGLRRELDGLVTERARGRHFHWTADASVAAAIPAVDDPAGASVPSPAPPTATAGGDLPMPDSPAVTQNGPPDDVSGLAATDPAETPPVAPATPQTPANA